LPKTFESLLATTQTNVFPAMLEDLAQHLGVSADSLRRLAPGWLPIATFKKGKNFQGWWTVAERDANGLPTGLSLRNQSDAKTAYPTSKHGMFYEVNPLHELGATGNDRGNWIRVHEAGVVCPVCGKGDGCLVNSEKPDDLTGDATCIRHSSPQRVGDSVRETKFGHLHSCR
jgi:hypothetical protein